MLNMLLSLRTFNGENVRYNLCSAKCAVKDVQDVQRGRSKIQSDLSPLLPPQPNLLSDAAAAYNAAHLIIAIIIIFIIFLKNFSNFSKFYQQKIELNISDWI